MSLGVYSAAYNPQLNLTGSATYDTGANYDGGPMCRISADNAGNAYLGIFAPGAPDFSSSYMGMRYAQELSSQAWSVAQRFSYSGFAPNMVSRAYPGGGMAFVGAEAEEPDYIEARRLRRVNSSGTFQAPVELPIGFVNGIETDALGNVYAAGFSPAGSVPMVLKVDAAGAAVWTLELADVADAGAAAVGDGGVYVAGLDLSGQAYAARYGTAVADTTPPAAAADLAVTGTSTNSATLAWTAPGNDGTSGQAASYDVRYTSSGLIVTEAAFAAAAQAVGEPGPKAAGQPESFVVMDLSAGATYYFALKTQDAAGNISGLSNSPSGRTAGAAAGRISISTGNLQIGVVGRALPVPLTVLVQDASSAALAGAGVEFAVSSGAAGFDAADSATGADGKARAVLRLGSTPAEYEAICSCPGCEVGAGTVTFRACGKLENDDFKQYDLEWSDFYYANTNSTIGILGCALTSLATLNNFYRNSVSGTIPETDPGKLNASLRDLGTQGYDGSAVDWGAIRTLSGNRIRYLGRTDVSVINTRQELLSRADADLLLGRPVIFKIRRRRADGTFGQHFVLAVGRCGSEYTIADPGSGTRRSFEPNDPDFAFMGIRRFSSTQ
ncbi:MAG: fibronectin type III domain-containing protein [Elusimicrobiota bacterium]